MTMMGLSLDERHRPTAVCLLVLVLYLLPGIPFLFDTQFLIHDFLNSNVVWYSILEQSGSLLASSDYVIDHFLIAVPRGCMSSELSIVNLIFQFLPLSWALLINSAFIHLVAFLGMLRLLQEFSRSFDRTDKLNSWFIHLVSLGFAVLPFWTPVGLSVAGQPLIILAFIRLSKNPLDLKALLILFIIPFFSSFVFSTLFFLIELGVGWLVLVCWKKRLFPGLLVGMFILAVVSILVDYRLFYMQFVEGMVSQRVPEAVTSTLNLVGFIGVSIKLFFQGQYHAHSNAFPWLIGAVFGLMLFVKERKLLFFVLFAMFLQFLFVSTLNLRDWDLMARILPPASLVNVVQMRFYSILPVFWHVLVVVLVMGTKPVFNRRATLAISGVFLIVIFSRLINYGIDDYQESSFADNRFYSTVLSPEDPKYKTLNSYYKTELFDTINVLLADRFDKSKFKLACFDIEPQIAQMNGFKTPGGYFPFFPMESKLRFLEYVETEYKLNNPKYLQQIEGWGSQCYFKLKKHEVCPIPLFDYDKMYDDGVRMVFSRSAVCEPRLELIGEIHDSTIDHYFYLYELKAKVN